MTQVRLPISSETLQGSFLGMFSLPSQGVAPALGLLGVDCSWEAWKGMDPIQKDDRETRSWLHQFDPHQDIPETSPAPGHRSA